MKKNIKKLLLSGIEWRGCMEYDDDYGKLTPLPFSCELVIDTSIFKRMDMELLKQYVTDTFVGYGDESYVRSIQTVEEVITRLNDVTHEWN